LTVSHRWRGHLTGTLLGFHNLDELLEVTTGVLLGNVTERHFDTSIESSLGKIETYFVSVSLLFVFRVYFDSHYVSFI